MSLDDVRGPVEYWRKLARTSGGMQPPDVDVAMDDAEALVDLADRAYEAASHLRDRERTDRERADYADGYYTSSTISGRHAAELEDCLARLDGEDTP